MQKAGIRTSQSPQDWDRHQNTLQKLHMHHVLSPQVGVECAHPQKVSSTHGTKEDAKKAQDINSPLFLVKH